MSTIFVGGHLLGTFATGSWPQLGGHLFLEFPSSSVALDHGIPSGSEHTATEGGDPIFSADIISLEDFVAHLRSDDSGSDLWFEPEPIGAVI
ncbi:hypothetical protein A4U53_005375 (plasmid) [Rhizobium ruizarguesonis]|uniref:Uncharacterized protein n=2 Tax=Rhizobium TaxID=379 RepID=A0A179BAE8_RHILE|nr:hypothetical protein [Rhizobium leguminosarum]OAP88081.1 hypothetical protein A4U53_35780 [Rhizobium leguminosarum]